MIRAIIVEDDAINTGILKELLKQNCPEISIVAEAVNAKDAVPVIKKNNPELIFLDIEMPFGGAFELLKNLLPVNFEIIFTTAFSQYALQAIRYSALDYLLKPVNAEELKVAVAKASARVNEKNINDQLKNLFSILSTDNNSSPKLALQVKNGYEFVEIADIIHCHALNNYTHILATNGKKYLSQKTLNEYEELTANHSFYRVHHSHLINTRHIKKYHKDGRKGGSVELSNGTMIEIAARRKEDFLATIIKG